MSIENFTRIVTMETEPPEPQEGPEVQGEDGEEPGTQGGPEGQGDDGVIIGEGDGDDGVEGQGGDGGASVRGRIVCYVGRQKLKSYGISVEGSGTWAQGHIAGTLMAYDYKEICKVYGLSGKASMKQWLAQYKKDKKGAKLLKVFKECKLVPMSYSVSFQIEGNDFGIAGVYFTCRVIRLKFKGISKDFLVTSPSAIEAVTPEGQKYPGGFRVTRQD